ncbi:ferritin-like domain-containing protein [Bacillus marinisedimentorum]|uniref:ferritin-like domain-containing protein n=1 Tax=Bacillus marinisedimentorum TaxID=1821260 RepID=UPI000871B9C1|nr:ferritin-like domain-containing protein [Bacillus marinisedimentorum]
MSENLYFYNCSPDYFRQPNDTQLESDIQKAINAEYSAISCYGQLARLAPTPDERNRILEIREDERRHYREFLRIYTGLTGRQPASEIIEECPGTYRDGIVFSFKDEQDAADFYQDIADRAGNPMIKDRFRRAAADEQNHAVWFLFFIHNAQRSYMW